MYAVVETGGKQYNATPGGTIDVEKLPGEAGEQITLDQVLLIVDGETVTVGRPTVAGATVTATVVGGVITGFTSAAVTVPPPLSFLTASTMFCASGIPEAIFGWPSFSTVAAATWFWTAV